MDQARLDLIGWRCRHCDSRNELLDGQPTTRRDRSVLSVIHEPDCPDFVSPDEPAAEYVDGVRVSPST